MREGLGTDKFALLVTIETAESRMKTFQDDAVVVFFIFEHVVQLSESTVCVLIYYNYIVNNDITDGQQLSRLI